jgi:4-methyl-5(b-hydroxyethyl)-thiazole monophosphate biosynthesis
MSVPKVLVVFAEGFEEIEGLVPVDLLKRAGAQVVMAGVGSREITGSHGIRIVCDIEVSEADSNYDCMVCPGGMPGSVNLAHSWEVMQRVVKVAEHGVVCAICAAPAVVLGPAGLLDGRKAVCYPGQEAACPSVRFSDERVLVDGGVITARGAGCAVEFSLAIIEKLFGKAKADSVSAGIIWK